MKEQQGSRVGVKVEEWKEELSERQRAEEREERDHCKLTPQDLF